MTPPDRFTLAEVGRGALMLDLVSGRAFTLNESGTFVWQSWLSGASQAEISERFAVRYGLSPAQAGEDVASALAIDTPSGAEADGPPPAAEFHYARAAGEYVFRFRDVAVLTVDERGQHLTATDRVTDDMLPWLLQSISPKILALRGHTVLHAAAVALNGRIIAISGESGAGKTTTARALARAGAKLVAEDKLPVLISGSSARASLAGEQPIADWVSSAAGQLRESRRADCSSLDSVFAEPIAPLGEIGFIAAEHRTASGVHSARPLDAVEAAGQIFRECFYGSDAAGDWRRHLRAAAVIAQAAAIFELNLPDGLERLAGAATRIVSARSLRS